MDNSNSFLFHECRTDQNTLHAGFAWKHEPTREVQTILLETKQSKVINPRPVVEARKTSSSKMMATTGANPLQERVVVIKGPTWHFNLENSDQINPPWWMWLVAWTEIITAAYLTVCFIYSVFTVSTTEINIFLWKVYCGGLVAVTEVVQIFAIRGALKRANDSEKLWFCKIWFLCQVPFVLEILLLAILYAAMGIPSALVFRFGFEVTTGCACRIVCTFLVQQYYHLLQWSIRNAETNCR